VHWSYNCSKPGKKGSFNYTIVIQGSGPDTTTSGRPRPA
jgi:hypothetical protein